MAASKNIRNIRPEEPDRFEWDDADPAKSLHKIRNAVEVEGQKAIDWYWKAKRWKRIPSQSIQFCALLLTAAAGLVPIILQVIKNARAVTTVTDSGPLAALFIGIAAALLGLDKAFGYSSGWTRYVLTATSMTKLLHEFRMDWIALWAGAAVPPAAAAAPPATAAAPPAIATAPPAIATAPPATATAPPATAAAPPATAAVQPTAEQRAAMIQRAKDFVSTIQGMIAQETKDWATEFQSNMAQMEKDLKTQLDSLKAQVDKDAKDKEAAAKAGAIELTVTNADKTDSFSFDVVLQGQSGKSTDSVSNSKVWTHINTVPGQYSISINAKYKGSIVSTATIVDVQPGGKETPSVTLPIA
jgi:hypothetical protein